MAAPLSQMLIWTAVPAGIEGGRLKLSVVVSPRLYSTAGKAPLADYDLAEWPARINAAAFVVELGNQKLDAGIDVLTKADPALWQAVFPKPLGVVTFTFDDYTGRPLWSYPVGHIAETVQAVYTKVATSSPEDHPPLLSPLLDPLDDLVWGQAAQGELTQIANQLAELQRKALAPAPADPVRDWALLRRFHGPKPVSPTPLKAPDLDFHEAVAALGHHPRLQRRLGLVVDLLLPVGPDDVPNNGEVRVTVDVSPKLPTVSRSTRVKYRIAQHPDGGGKIFIAAPRGDGPPLEDGLLNLQKGYGITQFDPDSGGLQLLGTAETRALGRRREIAAGRRRLTLPVLRSGGLQVYRTGLAYELAGAFDVQKKLDGAAQNGDPTAYAEDILRGWLIDVFDVTSQRWFGLCRRQVTYSAPGLAPFVEADETPVTIGLTSGADDSAEMAAHEVLCRWDGWSLVAPRPGTSVGADGQPIAQGGEPVAPLQLNVAIEPPETSLPRLRFGRVYRLRARALDLAGGALALPAQPTTTASSPPLTYRRFEPVGPPVLVPAASLAKLPAEKVDVLVLRSDAGGGVDVAGYSAKHGLPTDSVRHLVPPRASVELAEAHGLLDGPTVGLSKLAFDLIKAYEADLPEVAGAAAIDPPYLVDPLARGACFRGLPGAQGPYLRGFANTAQSWPKAEPFRLRIVGGPHQPPAWDQGTRTVTVAVAPGETRVIRLSCHLAEADLPLLGLYRWITEQVGDALEATVRDGRHWMVTPYREITLVHAVQRPLAAATVEQPIVKRLPADTSATVAGLFRNHAKSTGRIDLLADWTEPLDDPAKPVWETITGRAQVHEQIIEYPPKPADDEVDTEFTAVHEFGDTKYRQVGYHTVATTRYREFLPISDAAIEDGSEPISVVGPPRLVEVPSTARPAAPDVAYVIPTFRWERQAAGQAISSERRGGLRVYLRRPWFSSGAGEQLAVILAVGDPPAAARGLVSYWGNDPVFGAPALPSMRPEPDAFGHTAGPTEADLTIAEAVGVTVRAVPFAVSYDADRELWFADIDLDAPGGYWPFVRLALARYQPISIDKTCKLSRIVVADYAQVAPDRFATLTRDGANLTVSLSGPTFDRAPDGLGGAIVEVEFERQLQPDPVGWISLGAATDMPRVSRARRPTWRAVMPLPTGPGPLRAVIREYELLPADAGPTRRLVYAEALPLQ